MRQQGANLRQASGIPMVLHPTPAAPATAGRHGTNLSAALRALPWASAAPREYARGANVPLLGSLHGRGRLTAAPSPEPSTTTHGGQPCDNPLISLHT